VSDFTRFLVVFLLRKLLVKTNLILNGLRWCENDFERLIL
jgi:hypothetical protein